ncbi:hypothetical protein IV203_023833 [Nitzschia inconspicua]|uniref:Uncharacterized protein n=1 Tax=Nitzschia inconspicua TaxID=303405 RepID=A0A9K3KBS6_9STRA|nr:hypothetical protein IV203_023833 [Nitzschia inconspicua]
MIGHQMAMFALYIRRHLRGPYFLAAMQFPLPLNRERPADALPIEVALETTAGRGHDVPSDKLIQTDPRNVSKNSIVQSLLSRMLLSLVLIRATNQPEFPFLLGNRSNPLVNGMHNFEFEGFFINVQLAAL